MIDTKELRRKLRSDDPIDHIDIHANVKPVLTELLDRLEAVEKERDSYKFAFSEYSEKTEWVQQGINDGTVSAKYLCWHRADVMSDLLRAAEKERNFAKTEIARLHGDIRELTDVRVLDEEDRDLLAWLRGEAKAKLDRLEAAEKERDALRAKIEAMERQEPVATVRINAINGNPSVDFVPGHRYLHHNDKLYLAPGAQPAPSAPDGWKLVPMVSTYEMDMAGSSHCDGYLSTAQMVWDAMLAAAPEKVEQ